MMDQQVFQYVWNSQLQAQFEEQTSALFLKPGQSPKILAARSHPVSPINFSPVSTWSASEETQVDEKECIDHARSAREDFDVITNVSELEEFKSSGSDITFYSVGNVGNTWSRLALTPELLGGLCCDLKYPNVLKNMISHMGYRDADEVRPPLPHLCKLPEYVKPGGSEFCYALRYVAKNSGRSIANPWSIRQFVVHSKNESNETQASWLFMALPQEWFHETVKLSRLPRPDSKKLTLHMHQLLLQQSLASWRPYTSWLEKEVTTNDRLISFATPSGKIRNDLSNILLRLRNLENQVEEARCSLQCNIPVIDTLKKLSKMLSGSYDNTFGTAYDTDDEIDFATQQTQMILSQLDSLKSKLHSCSQLASSFLVQNIATISAAEATKSRHDAATVKALTIVASVFLPTTLVLNFFSTQFVEIKENGVVIANEWWLFLAVGVPLTCLVFGAWIAYVSLCMRSLRKDASSTANMC